MKKVMVIFFLLCSLAGLVASIVVHLRVVTWQLMPPGQVAYFLKLGSFSPLLFSLLLQDKKTPYAALTPADQQYVLKKCVPLWVKTLMIGLAGYLVVMMFIDGMPGGKGDLEAMAINSRFWSVLYAIMFCLCGTVLRCWHMASGIGQGCGEENHEA